MIGYFQSIPKELDEAALIDGASHMQMLTKIFIPVALPGIIAADLCVHRILGGIRLPDGVPLFRGPASPYRRDGDQPDRGDVYKWGMLMAGALVAAAPPLVIYAFLMDYYIAGLTAGATKG